MLTKTDHRTIAQCLIGDTMRAALRVGTRRVPIAPCKVYRGAAARRRVKSTVKV